MDRAFGKLRAELRRLGISDNTILWYCSDNGGLPRVGSTGARGHKGRVYDGGLRVPGILEWPARVAEPRVAELCCNTSDIYPTLLDIAGVKMAKQPPLDGVSLVPLIDGAMSERPRPMGFWDYPIKGIRTPSKEWMQELLEAQKQGREPEDASKLRLDAGKIRKAYTKDSYPGHSAWLDWPWKLHRIERLPAAGGPSFELYNLAQDPMEKSNLAGAQPDRAKAMRTQLDAWLSSVVDSLNGKDYS